MRKTNRELAEFYGIEEGDIVTIYDDDGDDSIFYGEFKCEDLDEMCPLIVITCREDCLKSMGIGNIRNRRYEVIKPKKKVGETLCDDYENCHECPLYLLRCDGYDGKNTKWPLYRVLNEICYKVGMKSDNPIYKAFRAELDKEVE